MTPGLTVEAKSSQLPAIGFAFAGALSTPTESGHRFLQRSPTHRHSMTVLPLSVSRPTSTPNQPSIGFSGVLDAPVQWISRNIYNAGDGVRYAVDQTVGLTAPRTYHQLKRTSKITGEDNPNAALELLVRDLAADVADTFAPGIIATLLIGRGLDAVQGHKTWVGQNMGSDALNTYAAWAKKAQQSAGKATARDHFYTSVEKQLQKAHPNSGKSLNLAKAIRELQKPKGRELNTLAQRVAEALGKSDLDLVLHSAHPTTGAKTKLTVTLPQLLRDMWHIDRKMTRTQAPNWGQELAQRLTHTRKLVPTQNIANVLALGASLSIPFLVRLMTIRLTGKDAFPGTEAIREHYQKQNMTFTGATPEADAHPPQEPQGKKRFELFPYISQSLKKGNAWPAVIAGGFFATLFGTIYARHFLAHGVKNPFNLKHLAKVYEFERGGVWTTVTQMELTYGLLCGIRLASSRNDADFRESAFRDCLLGWTTLTYFFPFLKGVLSRRADKTLMQQFGKPLLMKPNGETRSIAELPPAFFKRLGVKGGAETAAKAAAIRNDYITVGTALASISLLSVVEPKLDIAITNTMEQKRMAANQPKPAAHAILAPSISPIQGKSHKAHPLAMPPVVANPHNIAHAQAPATRWA